MNELLSKFAPTLKCSQVDKCFKFFIYAICTLTHVTDISKCLPNLLFGILNWSTGVNPKPQQLFLCETRASKVKKWRKKVVPTIIAVSMNVDRLCKSTSCVIIEWFAQVTKHGNSVCFVSIGSMSFPN